MRPYLVSICMITYGHENFIKQAIESVLNQKINFEFELIISNDNSPDETDRIIQLYLIKSKFKDKIKYFNHSLNIGAIPNFVFALSQCQGKYIAICEGDDYWIDENKLQSQFDFLESNSKYVSCGSQIYSINGLIDKVITQNNIDYIEGKTYSYTDLALVNRIPFVTAFFRNNLTPEKLELIKKSPHGDWPTHIAVAENDSSLYFVSDRITAVYRLHEGGIYSMQKNEVKKINTAKTLNCLNQLTKNKFSDYYYLLSLFLMKNWEYKDVFINRNYSIINIKLVSSISKLIEKKSNFIKYGVVFNKLFIQNPNINIRNQIFNLYIEIKPNKFCLLIPNKLNLYFWTQRFF